MVQIKLLKKKKQKNQKNKKKGDKLKFGYANNNFWLFAISKNSDKILVFKWNHTTHMFDNENGLPHQTILSKR